jgi:hypothetical protein
VLAPARCGTITAADPVDFLTFRLQATTKQMSINFNGQVRLHVTVGGRAPVDLTPQNAGAVPFVLGQTYLIQVSALTPGSTVSYRVAIVEK